MPRVQPVLSWWRCCGAVAILLITINLMVSASRAYASCWAENSTGERSCGFFKSRTGNLDLWLCEDKQGDCEKVGYTPLPTRRIKTPTQSSTEPAQASPNIQPTPRSEASTREKKATSVEPAANSTSAGPTNTPTAADTPPDDNVASNSSDATFTALFFCFLLVGGAAFGFGWLLESHR
ncbi:MAG TPA: hypothetical protein VKV05_15055 [Terriglobales bacterium]|nr:hypothetical protein [Terriglobales bacterium]